MRVLKRLWIPLVIAVVLSIGGFGAYHLHGAFPAHGADMPGHVDVIQPINVKQVTYEISGPSDTVGYVSYLDENAQAHGVQFVSLPWSFTVTTTLPGVFASVVAQGNSDTIGCRIVVNGEVREEQSAARLNAQTFCLVKAA